MKTLPALLVAVALISPAFAQNVALHPNLSLQEAQKRHPGPIATPAFKPILLHTGKAISANDKTQLVISAKQMYAATTLTRTPEQKPNIKAVDTTPKVTDVTITPAQMFQGNQVFGRAYSPILMSPGENWIWFQSGVNSDLDITFTANANMIYSLIVKVRALTNNQQFTIEDSWANAESFTGSGEFNEFAYSLIAKSAGSFEIKLYSTNAQWEFESCEIIGTPIN
jgi:hypothetical protein